MDGGKRRDIVTWYINLSEDEAPVTGLHINGRTYSPDQIVAIVHAYAAIAQEDDGHLPLDVMYRIGMAVAHAVARSCEGKSVLVFLARKAAYAVLSDPKISREAATISEEGREVLAQFIGKKFVELLNELRQK
jgi:hypothetical protein